MLISSYHFDVKYRAKASFLWQSAGFFERLSGEDSADPAQKNKKLIIG
jgi:hypothetical protein